MSKMSLKIHEGTGKLTGRALCFSCTHCLRRGDDMVCQQNWSLPVRITKPVFNCNRYYDASLPTVREYEAVAWELKSKGGRMVGFKPPDPDRAEPPDDDF